MRTLRRPRKYDMNHTGLRIQLPGAVCGGRIRIQLLSELYVEAGYAYSSDLSCMRTELYALLQPQM